MYDKSVLYGQEYIAEAISSKYALTTPFFNNIVQYWIYGHKSRNAIKVLYCRSQNNSCKGMMVVYLRANKIAVIESLMYDVYGF